MILGGPVPISQAAEDEALIEKLQAEVGQLRKQLQEEQQHSVRTAQS